MNHRITELARQAGLYFRSEIVRFENDITHMKEVPCYDLFDYVKFAELIINECSTVCKTVGNTSVSNASIDYNEGRAMAAEVCHNSIKQHFGVKE